MAYCIVLIIIAIGQIRARHFFNDDCYFSGCSSRLESFVIQHSCSYSPSLIWSATSSSVGVVRLPSGLGSPITCYIVC